MLWESRARFILVCFSYSGLYLFFYLKTYYYYLYFIIVIVIVTAYGLRFFLPLTPYDKIDKSSRFSLLFFFPLTFNLAAERLLYPFLLSTSLHF